MNANLILFYLLAGAILGMAMLSVTTKNLFRAAIWLLFSLVGIAGLYFLLQLEFLAAVQIIVYVGGIVVLIIFSIFLTQQNEQDMPAISIKRKIPAAIACVSGLLLSVLILLKCKFPISGGTADWSVQLLGEKILNTEKNGYALPFELISLLLLASMIGCIVIALKPQTKNS